MNDLIYSTGTLSTQYKDVRTNCNLNTWEPQWTISATDQRWWGQPLPQHRCGCGEGWLAHWLGCREWVSGSQYILRWLALGKELLGADIMCPALILSSLLRATALFLFTAWDHKDEWSYHHQGQLEHREGQTQVPLPLLDWRDLLQARECLAHRASKVFAADLNAHEEAYLQESGSRQNLSERYIERCRSPSISGSQSQGAEIPSTTMYGSSMMPATLRRSVSWRPTHFILQWKKHHDGSPRAKARLVV